jgi:hypothetical protein
VLKLSEALTGWRPSDTGSYTPIILLEAGWEEIVGAEVAQHSAPAHVAEGTLTITTRSSAWSHQLSFLSEHLLRAVAARVPGARVERLRFRVGRIAKRPMVIPRRRTYQPRLSEERPGSACAAEALARFRRDVEQRRGAQRAQGWEECAECGALVAPGARTLCAHCSAEGARRRADATARLLFEAPWLGYAGTAALVTGLQVEEYERSRSRLLRQWWGILSQARAAGRLSRDGRERLVASSYVLLQSNLPPEEIIPATLRNILGDELHDLLYGAARREGGAEKRRKRRA